MRVYQGDSTVGTVSVSPKRIEGLKRCGAWGVGVGGRGVSVSPKRIEGLKRVRGVRDVEPRGDVSVSPKRIEGLKPGEGGDRRRGHGRRFQYPLSGSKD